jgi:hypothetical protein
MFGCTRRHRQRGSAYQPGCRGIRFSSARWKGSHRLTHTMGSSRPQGGEALG